MLMNIFNYARHDFTCVRQSIDMIDKENLRLRRCSVKLIALGESTHMACNIQEQMCTHNVYCCQLGMYFLLGVSQSHWCMDYFDVHTMADDWFSSLFFVREDSGLQLFITIK